MRSMLERVRSLRSRGGGRLAPGAAVLLLLLALLAGGCGGAERSERLPEPEAAAERYSADARGELRGNLLQIELTVDPQTLRGGPIWARSGPYFYLFSPPTQELFAEFADLAAIRVVTAIPDGTEVARAELRRDALNEVRWREALFRSAVAQRDGTERPRALEELRYFGEDHTEFRYNPEFAGR
jgi:hypothetical protein